MYSSIARGTATVLSPGVYIATSALPDDIVQLHQLGALAVQMRRLHLVASHQSAALVSAAPLLDAKDVAARPPRFTRAPGPGVRSSRKPDVTIRDLPPDAITEVPSGLLQGLRLTTPARTALDLAHELELPAALMLTDAVARSQLQAFRGRALEGELTYAARRASLEVLENAAISAVHRRDRIRRVLALTDPLRESAAESSSYGWFAVEGLPLPRCQVRLATAVGVARVDFYWEDLALVGECDGNVKYDGTFGESDDALVKQNVREQALKEAGFVVVRWTAREALFRPDLMIERVASRLLGLGWSGDRA